jgi:putative transposase
MFLWINKNQDTYSINRCCRVIGLNRSSYYAWRNHTPSVRDQRNTQLLKEIQSEYARGRRSYGAPSIHEALVKRKIRVCKNTIAKLMKKAGIRSIRCGKFCVQTTQSDHGHPIAPNVLNRNFVARTLNQKWLSDITCIPTDEGMLYMASVLDVCSRKIVGWQIADHLRAGLCLDAQKMALESRQPQGPLIHHSDRGVQYACDEYQRLLINEGITVSMSRRGNCYDNAMMESYHASYKLELVYQQQGKQFRTKAQALSMTFEWIEVFYNRQRRHSAIGYISPEQFEAGLN